MMVGMGAIGFTLCTFVYGHFGPQLPVRQHAFRKSLQPALAHWMARPLPRLLQGIVQADVDALIQIEKSGKKADEVM